MNQKNQTISIKTKKKINLKIIKKNKRKLNRKQLWKRQKNKFKIKTRIINQTMSSQKSL